MGSDPQNSPPDPDGRRHERAVNARERPADRHERKADERERTADGTPPSRRQRSYEQIDRVRDLLTASHARLDRSESALRRADAGDVRDQDSIDRETITSASWETADTPAARTVLEARVQRLRQQAVTTLETLSNAQHRLANDHEEHDRPQRAAEHRRHAEEAREAADALRASAVSDDGRAEK
ncbi:hypothetical protein ABZ921_23275 [Streptomyces atriruber]|uniref:Uncharacterized protein n=1 Tax=Streptomyces atriruber TaxID=545121 RepID=A0ABV3BRC1_9ACTN